MQHRTFPPWSGPFVGMVAGALFGIRAGRDVPVSVSVFIVGGAVIGGLAGCLIFLIDPRPPEEVSEGLPLHFANRKTKNPSGVVGRFVAVIGASFCWVPFLGLALNLLGLAINWRSDDWARKSSKIALYIACPFSVLGVIALVLEA